MPGYDLRCGNCHKCWHCKGNGSIIDVKWEKSSDGRQRKVERRITCPRCGGRGGSVGPGPHNHR